MKIVSFIIENYKAIRGRKEFSPNASSFVLIGPNGHGKTSAGRAILDIVTHNVPSKPVSDGELDGYVEYTFDNGQKLLAKFNVDGKSKIELITKEGLKVHTPKELWKQLSGNAMTFDIDDFINMAPKPRRALLEKITGVDLSALNAKEIELEEKRRDAGVLARNARAKVGPYNKEMAEMELIDVRDAIEKIQEAKELNASIARVQKGCEDRKTKIEELNAEILKLNNELAEGLSWLNTNKAPDETKLEDLQKSIDNFELVKTAKVTAKADQDAIDLEKEAARIDTLIKQLRQQKEDVIKSVIMPAEGMRFDGDDILLDGLPFESNQISASRKIIAAIQISQAMLGEIRYLHFDGAALDKKNTDMILEWAEKHDLQLCIERPTWDSSEGLKMEIIEP